MLLFFLIEIHRYHLVSCSVVQEVGIAIQVQRVIVLLLPVLTTIRQSCQSTCLLSGLRFRARRLLSIFCRNFMRTSRKIWCLY
jgi:hypothetical protein